MHFPMKKGWALEKPLIPGKGFMMMFSFYVDVLERLPIKYQHLEHMYVFNNRFLTSVYYHDMVSSWHFRSPKAPTYDRYLNTLRSTLCSYTLIWDIIAS